MGKEREGGGRICFPRSAAVKSTLTFLPALGDTRTRDEALSHGANRAGKQKERDFLGGGGAPTATPPVTAGCRAGLPAGSGRKSQEHFLSASICKARFRRQNLRRAAKLRLRTTNAASSSRRGRIRFALAPSRRVEASNPLSFSGTEVFKSFFFSSSPHPAFYLLLLCSTPCGQPDQPRNLGLPLFRVGFQRGHGSAP